MKVFFITEPSEKIEEAVKSTDIEYCKAESGNCRFVVVEHLANLPNSKHRSARILARRWGHLFIGNAPEKIDTSRVTIKPKCKMLVSEILDGESMGMSVKSGV